MMNFCPLCKSIMKDGICTNRNCGNSQFEIDFNKTIEIFTSKYPKQFKIINNSYVLANLLENHQTYKFKNLSIDEDLRNFGFSLINNTKVNIKNICEYLIENKIPIDIKLTGIAEDTSTCICASYKLFKLKEIKKIPSHSFKLYKFYLQVSQLNEQIIKNGEFVLGTNDFMNWVNVGDLYYDESDLNQVLEEFLNAIEHLIVSSKFWTLKAIDNKTGVGLKTFFEKEYAYNFFKDREIKIGKQRRTPLKHIVDDYERNTPKKVLVKEHLRGDMVFEWRNITFKLYPPIIDNRRINGI